MNEEIEYAEMLEIPVSTVNVVRKNARKPKANAAAENAPLKASVIARVNDRMEEDRPSEEAFATNDFAENADEGCAEEEQNGGCLRLEPIADRIDTLSLYSEEEADERFRERADKNQVNGEKIWGRYAAKRGNEKIVRRVLGVELAAACALCGGIFLTNVFRPNSAINTFFRTIGSYEQTATTDARKYTDFTLTSVVSELSETELTLSPTGILSFKAACCVYPAADGTVAEVTKANDGTYSVKIAHSDSFTGIINGLDYVYYAAGDVVKANVPVGYSEGEKEVQVTMYSEGALLSCLCLTEENCLAWVSASSQS